MTTSLVDRGQIAFNEIAARFVDPDDALKGRRKFFEFLHYLPKLIVLIEVRFGTEHDLGLCPDRRSFKECPSPVETANFAFSPFREPTYPLHLVLQRYLEISEHLKSGCQRCRKHAAIANHRLFLMQDDIHAFDMHIGVTRFLAILEMMDSPEPAIACKAQDELVGFLSANEDALKRFWSAWISHALVDLSDEDLEKYTRRSTSHVRGDSPAKVGAKCEFEIRAGEPGDKMPIEHICEACSIGKLRGLQATLGGNTGSRVDVAVLNEQVIGVAGYCLHHRPIKGDHYSCVMLLAIHPRFQEQGYGRKLLCGLARDCSQFNILVSKSHNDSEEFLKRCGFEFRPYKLLTKPINQGMLDPYIEDVRRRGFVRIGDYTVRIAASGDWPALEPMILDFEAEMSSKAPPYTELAKPMESFERGVAFQRSHSDGSQGHVVVLTAGEKVIGLARAFSEFLIPEGKYCAYVRRVFIDRRWQNKHLLRPFVNGAVALLNNRDITEVRSLVGYSQYEEVNSRSLQRFTSIGFEELLEYRYFQTTEVK